MVRSRAQPHAQYLFRAQRIDDRLHPVVPGGRSALADSHRSQRKVQLVINHEQILLRVGLVFPGQFQHRHAAQVHEGLRFGQQQLFVAEARPGRQCLAVPVIDRHATLRGQPVDQQKADVVRRKLVFDTRIAKTNDQLHAFYFLVSAFLPSLPSAAGASSVSCLPFLMTSGSAVVVAAAASAAASGVATTSSFTEVTWATVWAPSGMYLILSLCGRPATGSRSPKASAEPSASLWLGISIGRHSISTSRMTWSIMPPCCFPPAASPTRWMGTFTRIFSVSEIRFRSMCSSLPLIGSYCQSTIMALAFSSPSSRSKMVL